MRGRMCVHESARVAEERDFLAEGDTHPIFCLLARSQSQSTFLPRSVLNSSLAREKALWPTV